MNGIVHRKNKGKRKKDDLASLSALAVRHIGGGNRVGLVDGLVHATSRACVGMGVFYCDVTLDSWQNRCRYETRCRL